MRMSIFEPHSYIHLICCLGLICAINITWNLSLQPDSNIHLYNICSSGVGCKPLHNNIKDCKKLRISCTGSQRCCFDCYNSRMKYLSLLNFDMLEITPNMTVTKYKFFDTYTAPMYACVSGIIVIFVMNIILLILYTLCKKYDKEKNPKKVICRICAYFCLILLFFLTVGFTTFNIAYIFFHLTDLYKCQPSLIMLISTGIVLLLCLFEFISDVAPSKMSKKYTLSLKNQFVHTVIKICMAPILLFLHIFSRLSMIWWITITIYLIGVIYDKWTI